MYGNKKTFRLIGSIGGIVLSAGLIISSVFEISLVMSEYYGDAYWSMSIYIASLFMAIASLVFSIMLCQNKAPQGMAITMIAISGVVAMADLASIILLQNFFAVMNMLLWIAVIVMLSLYLATKEGVPSPRNENAYVPKHPYVRTSAPAQYAPAPQKETEIESKIAVFDKLKAEGKLTDEEYKDLLMKMLEK